MAKRKRDWAWRRLAEAGGQPRPTRQIKYKGDPALRGIRQHAPHPTTPALDRFTAMTRRVLNRVEIVSADNHCVVWLGGETFRVDEKTITTPARFYWEMVKGENLGEKEVLKRGCKTPRCLKHKVKR